MPSNERLTRLKQAVATKKEERGGEKEDLKRIAKEAVANCQRSMDNLGLLLTEKDFYEIYKKSF